MAAFTLAWPLFPGRRENVGQWKVYGLGLLASLDLNLSLMNGGMYPLRASFSSAVGWNDDTFLTKLP